MPISNKKTDLKKGILILKNVYNKRMITNETVVMKMNSEIPFHYGSITSLILGSLYK